MSFVGKKVVLEEDKKGKMQMSQIFANALEKCTPFEIVAFWLAIVPKEIIKNVHSF